MITWTNQVHISQERNQVADAALVHASPVSDDVEVVQHLQQPETGLVDGSYHRSTAPCDLVQERNALHARGAVQSAERKSMCLFSSDRYR